MVTEFRPDSPLAALFLERGESCPAPGNRPVSLWESGHVWYVEEGAIDVLAAEYESGRMASTFKHFVRLEVGQLAFSVVESGHAMNLVSKGLQETRLRRLTQEDLLEALANSDNASAIRSELDRQIDFWVGYMSAAVSRDMEGIPATELRLVPGPMTGRGVASPDHGVVWLTASGMEASFLDLADTGHYGLVPVSRDAWIRLHRKVTFDCKSTSELDGRCLLEEALPGFHEIALDAESLNRRLLLVDEANLQVAQANRRRGEKARARTSLEALYNSALQSVGDESAMTRALRMIGRKEGFDIRIPSIPGNEEPSLADYCEASAIRKRRVQLSTSKRWWLGDSGAMLAIRREDGKPLVLIPGLTGRYRVVDPSTGESNPADNSTAALLQETHFLYPRLPGNGATGLKELFRTGSCGVAGDATVLVLTGIAAGALALTPAFAINRLVDVVAPGGNAVLALQLAATLVGIGALVALLHILRGTALMRVEGRVAARLGGLIWDRLLRLNPGFFRGHTAGELTARSMVFQDVRDQVAGVTADGVLSTLFLLPAFGLLFFYDAWLGWIALLLSAAMIGVTATFCILQIRPQHQYLETMRRLAGDTQQFLNGIAKLRTTGAEDLAFAAWARQYHGHKQAEIRLSILGEHLAAFGAAVPALASAVLFSIVAIRGDGGVDTADFLAVFTAVMVLCMAVIMLGNAARAIAFVKPACDQVLPILASPASTRKAGRVRPVLSGQILLDRASHAYQIGGPRVLDEVSISAKPGEFVAIVGESGAGKTTLFRLLLGLEKPDTGAVYYDGRDLAQLDFGVVRRQMGVVMQDSSLRPGSVLENIIGTDSDLTEDDAWRALEQVGVADEIRAMPMGLHTAVGENSANFSGGQSQRIRMAAALVYKPRIIFLDEPTSWLDTKSQALAMNGIEDSTSTRLIIAHRLSTIRKAHRIYVLHRGRLVQTGNYDELLAAEGHFRDLALRQTT